MKPWSFAFATDVHIGSPRSFRFQPGWNDNWQTARRQLLELQPDFLLLGGDLARDGIWHRQELEAAKAVPLSAAAKSSAPRPVPSTAAEAVGVSGRLRLPAYVNKLLGAVAVEEDPHKAGQGKEGKEGNRE